ncbi:MAG: aldehyde dehydrogenase [Candidatus Sericytochromatia bacterium]|nr:aldehyde dehydrogenase [Candidatus Tanganyikabacteria bacterium]
MRDSASIYINGEWVSAEASGRLTIENPATLAKLGEAAMCNAADVDRAVTAARRAQRGWWRVPGVEKAVLLREAAARLRADEHELAKLLSQETGKPHCEARDCIDWVAACFDYYGEVARRSFGNSVPPVAPHQVNFTVKEPFGVVAAIAPFNFPLLLMAWKVAPALAAGNAVVCKAPHQNPLSTLRLFESLEGLPPGVVNLLTGAAETGDALVRHKEVDCIAFTGSTATGRKIAALAGAELKKVNLELGGVDPFIVFDDADLDVAVPGVAWARLLNAGQVCTSSKRIYVPRSIAEEFLRRMVDHVKTLIVGDPMDPRTDIGPLITREALEKLENQVAESIEQGARLVLGGKRIQPGGLPGHFFEPTILADVPHGSLPTREELFGPVLAITVVEDNAQAIECANDSEYGLGACIYTNRLDLALEAMENIKAGTFWVNDPLSDNDAAPFGGMRHSGIGRELGEEGLDAFREPKHVHIDYRMERKSYWFPNAARSS